MGQSSISLKPVKDLLNMNFNIPDYQRGYRWTPQQAKDLLNDINEFMSKENKDESEIYCIQPLVVQEKKQDDLLEKIKEASSISEVKHYLKGSWNVVDGQQRLTTIFLILSYLNQDNLYSINYETRTNSKEFLEKVSEKEEKDANTNIDYYHIFNVYNEITAWFDGNKEIESDFLNTLLNKVCFIWYEVDNDASAEDVFNRLNVGKIPLTDSELIKALFLNRSNFSDDIKMLEHTQIRIASEWDSIEYALQNDEFWLFLNDDKYSKPTRIDFILDIISKNKDATSKKTTENDEHKTFRYFYELFNSKDVKLGKVEEWWAEIKSIYQMFDEWYHDYKLYHYIGYLVCMNASNISEYSEEWKKRTKDEFNKYIKLEIHNYLCPKKGNEWINEWDYVFDTDKTVAKKECVKLLLLHNVETIVQQNEKLIADTKYNLPNFTKFPFHLFKKENWQVEHIRPNSGDDLKDAKKQKSYLLIAKDYLTDSDLISDIERFVSKNEGEFDALVERIYEQDSSITDDDKNKIWNFTLLDESTNKEYGNAIFPIKRLFICNKEQGYKVKYEITADGRIDASNKIPEIAFIPPCTRNVFSKAYTLVPTTMIAWTKEDAEAYLEDMKQKVGSFIEGEKNE